MADLEEDVRLLKPEWVEMITADGESYWQNNWTKETQWERPLTMRPAMIKHERTEFVCSQCAHKQETAFHFCPDCGSAHHSDVISKSLQLKLADDASSASGAIYSFKRQQRIHVRSTERRLSIAIGKMALGVAEIVAAVLTGGLDPLLIVGVAKSVSTAVMNLRWGTSSKMQTFHRHELIENVWIWIRARYSTQLRDSTFAKKYHLKMDGVAVAIRPDNGIAYKTLQALVSKDAENTVDKIASVLHLEDTKSMSQGEHAASEHAQFPMAEITTHIQNELAIAIDGEDTDDDSGSETSNQKQQKEDVSYYRLSKNSKCTFSWRLLYVLIVLLFVSILHIALAFGYLIDFGDEDVPWDSTDGSVEDYAQFAVWNAVITLCVKIVPYLLGIVWLSWRTRYYYGPFCCCCAQRFCVLALFTLEFVGCIVIWALLYGIGGWHPVLATAVILSAIDLIMFIVCAMTDAWKRRLQDEPKYNSAKTTYC